MADDQEAIAPQNADEPSAETDEQEKAAIDTGKITAPSNRSMQKVELDLDDAAFLDDEEEIEDEPAEADKKALQEKDEKPAKKPFPFWKYKKFILAGLAVVLVGVMLFLWMFLRPKHDVPPVPPPVPEEESVPPPKEEPPELTEYLMSFEPFWVEFETNGTYRFLTCRFSFPVQGDVLKFEVDKKRIIIRDAVYYYFKNKNLVFLDNSDNAGTLKIDLLEIINQYLGNGQLEEILIQEYRVQ